MSARDPPNLQRHRPVFAAIKEDEKAKTFALFGPPLSGPAFSALPYLPICICLICSVLIHLCSVRTGRSSTRGRCSRRCLTCSVLVTAGIHHRACLMSGWPWSACCPVPFAMHSSSVTRRRSYNLSTRPNDSTAKRFQLHSRHRRS